MAALQEGDLAEAEPWWHSLPINEAGLSTRATRALLSIYANPATFPPFETIGAVAELSDWELLRWPGAGRRVLEEIRGRVRELERVYIKAER